MSDSMVMRLVLKDWHFQRWAIAAYLAAGGVALFLTGIGSEASFYAGTVLLITILITLGIHLAMATVVTERTEQTLPFIMSLPISPREYTTAKILANVLIFTIPWLTLVIGTVAVIGGRSAVPDGLIPFSTVILTEIFAAYLIVLAVAIVSESMGWTVGAMVTTNLFFQGFIYYVSHIPQIAREMKGDRAQWSAPVLTLLGAEVALMVALVAITCVLQNRKKDFL
jgi:ABC-type transport system involved in multi-copper enzyme maturation permease subunit